MEWIFQTLSWYFYLFVLGIIFFPLTKKIFSSFFDKGYAFSKTLGILLTSYFLFFFGTFKVIPFTRITIVLILIFTAIFSIILFYNKKTKTKEEKPIIFFIILEEILFIASLFFLTFIRGQEPSIRGLEKFMDFGFINSILRSKFFPPLDIWFASKPINYYYFGHLTGAVLIKLTNIKASIGYNLILATILAQGITMSFSLCSNIIYLFERNILKSKVINYIRITLYGLLGSFVVNLAGNLHTIYLFTTGYPNDNPIPFWKILSVYNPIKYWYPNATRFIPFTIHEFPSYSYVVADLHGHVFDIPFVLLTLSILFLLFVNNKKIQLSASIFLGFMASVHYMTNAFDGPIYMFLTVIVLAVVFKFDLGWLINIVFLILSFIFFSLPFSIHFKPFVNGVGVNCSPDFLLNIGRLGPFLFEKGNCQSSPFWMLFILWGFFWISFIIFLIAQWKSNLDKISPLFHQFIFILFSIGSFLIIIPEFFYIKDIYPAHFRANTMFKLGYQAFIMMSIASVFTLYLSRYVNNLLKIAVKIIFMIAFFFIFIYPFYSFPSYYGKFDKPTQLDGIKWLESDFLQDKEIIDYLNKTISNQPVILEAQGDSYTDYERISAYTGLPTVAGWWVHEWLWRGSSSAVGDRIPDVISLYESKDIEATKKLIKKYDIKFVIVSKLEKEKYKNLNEDKFNVLGRKIFTSSNKIGALYQLNN